MSTDTVCRVCLVDNLSLHGVRNDLQTAYERMTREKYNKVGYPLSMCYICRSVLQKCHRFMETAQDSNRLLKQWYNRQNEVTVVKPLGIYSVSIMERVSIGHEGALEDDIKTEVKSEPDYTEHNTHLDLKKTDMGEQTDCSDGPNDSPYIDTLEDDNDRQTDPLSYINVDIQTRNSLASDLDDHKKVVARSQVTSLHDNRVPSLKTLETNKTKLQHQAQETSRETALPRETSNDIKSLNTPLSQPENVKEGKFKIKSKRKNNKKETAKLNKIVKKNAVQNKTKRVRNAVKNVKSLNKVSLKTALNTSVTDSMLNANSDKHIDLNKYCEVCNLQCVNKDDLAKHMRLHDNSRPHVCDVCHYRYDIVSHLNSHKALIHKIDTITNEYICDVCNYKSKNKLHMMEHIQIHTGEKPLICKICGCKLGSKSHFIRHMRSHTGEKPFSCNLCDHKFSEKGTLNTHMKTHAGSKPFSCDICEYKTGRKNNLTTHMKTHTGEKPFSCDYCGHRYIRKYDLMIHIMGIHTGKKPFSCNICSYECTRKFDLNTHARTHTGEKLFFCNICSYKCIQKCDLNKHARTHTGEKPFSCNICSYKCARKGDLKVHIRSHTGEKPFSCDICDFKCSQRSSLGCHLLRHLNSKQS